MNFLKLVADIMLPPSPFLPNCSKYFESLRILYKGKNNNGGWDLTTGAVIIIPSPALAGMFISNRQGIYNKTFVPTAVQG